MSQKPCFKCDEVKPLSEFYTHPQMADGHLGKCKECAKADVKNHRARNLTRIRAYDRLRGNRQTPEYAKWYATTYPKKKKAQTAVGNAVRDGRLDRPGACEGCGRKGAVHGHHDDYDKPLEVRWLCPGCHHQWHAANGEALNAG